MTITYLGQPYTVQSESELLTLLAILNRRAA